MQAASKTTPPPISARAPRYACNACRSTYRPSDKKLAVALDGETLEAVLVDVTIVNGAERRVKTFGVRSRHVLKVLGKLLLIVPLKLKVSVYQTLFLHSNPKDGSWCFVGFRQRTGFARSIVLAISSFGFLVRIGFRYSDIAFPT